MYTDFYNLREKPFELNPSSRFLYLGEVHKEALALLAYGVSERKGFTLLTGEVGTGKTTMVHALISRLDENCQYVYLSNPVLSIREFFSYLSAAVFKQKIRFRTKADFLIEFEAFLRECQQHQKNFILIIDEAHKLSFELLEEIRLLSNMETADEKLINIFLAGQPELNEKLNSPECRALLQRINTRYHISPLDLRSTQEYITTRLRMAGGPLDVQHIFSNDVVKAIHKYSEGFPRMINILADNVLLLGYSRGAKKILPLMVKECFDDLRLDRFFEKGRPSEPEGETSKKAHNSVRIWKWATAVLSLVLISSFAFYYYKEDLFDRSVPLGPSNNNTALENSSENFLSTKNNVEHEQQKSTNSVSPGGQGTSVSLMNTEQVDKQVSSTAAGIEDSEVEKGKQDIGQVPPLSSTASSASDDQGPEGPRNLIESPSEENKSVAEMTVSVKAGDTLIGLATEIYGRSGEDILRLLKERNPEINQLDRIEIGQKIVFPVLPEINQGLTFTVDIASYEPFESAKSLFQELLKQGYEAYLMPVYNTQKGKFFRITLGNFKTSEEAEAYAKKVMEDKVSDYAKVIQLEMR
ncbi:hypothetical protein PITCH_A400008 [uncultured Desulfobacterium sp.]|uniref:SPOR domain-containing protein n=1 Tax=uncultured Desulfobacterium sp. TaxID=201089 RepID=A0A445MZW4_9BACT|nr:hypothetical protein PITCH_A400008 [uncultured Desulfobacterium sp.]